MKKDYDFLDDGKKQKGRVVKPGFLMTIFKIGVIAWCLLVAFVTVQKYLEVRRLEEEVKAETDFVNDPNVKRQILEQADKLKQKDELISQQNDYTILKYLSKYNDSGNADMISKITSTVADGMAIISGRKVALMCYANDLSVVGNYELILRTSGMFEKIEVNPISFMPIGGTVERVNENGQPVEPLPGEVAPTLGIYSFDVSFYFIYQP